MEQLVLSLMLPVVIATGFQRVCDETDQGHIRKPAQNFFDLVRARTSLYELAQAKKSEKHHKCQSDLAFR